MDQSSLEGNRHRFAQEALRWIPKILTLQDRNRHSPTYGCFDRNYWQYKIIDFPSGMSQEFVWPLALAWDTELEGNAFYKQDALRERPHEFRHGVCGPQRALRRLVRRLFSV
jgi:hypothetical protein